MHELIKLTGNSLKNGRERGKEKLVYPVTGRSMNALINILRSILIFPAAKLSTRRRVEDRKILKLRIVSGKKKKTKNHLTCLCF